MTRFFAALIAAACLISPEAVSGIEDTEPIGPREQWDSLTDAQKNEKVTRFIAEFAQEGVEIKKSPDYYRVEIDRARTDAPVARNLPIRDVMQTIAIQDYDFDEGIPKEITEMRYLGEAYKAMKEQDREEARTQADP